jgi:biopolymer transport protein ExbD
MRFKKEQNEEARLSIAPLIDIVFLLLIFFMVTSHFDVASGVRIELPKVVKKLYDSDTERIILLVDRTGEIYLKGKRLDAKALPQALKTLVEEEGISRLVLQADKDVKHGRVVEIMDVAKRAGVYSIIIAAKWRADKLL